MSRRSQAHRHVCERCGQSFICDGELSRNYDGEPPVVCAVYHEADHRTCEDCSPEAGS